MVTVRTNSHGMHWREVSIEKPKGVRRVAFVGDSFTFGESADDLSHCFVSLFEQQVGTDSVKVLNFGVPGYSLADMKLQLQEEVFSFSPDYVILALYPGNDVFESYLGIRKYMVRDGRLEWDRSLFKEKIPLEFRAIPVDLEQKSGLVGLVTRMKIYGRLRRVYGNFTQQPRPGEAAPTDAGNNLIRPFVASPRFRWASFWSHVPYPQVARRAVDVTLDELDTIRGMVATRGAVFMLVLLPYKAQVAADQETGTDLRNTAYDIHRPQSFVRTWAAKREVPCLDLLTEFRTQTRTRRKALFPLGTDVHFNTLGHKVAGEAIAAFFHEHVVVKGQATN